MLKRQTIDFSRCTMSGRIPCGGVEQKVKDTQRIGQIAPVGCPSLPKDGLVPARPALKVAVDRRRLTKASRPRKEDPKAENEERHRTSRIGQPVSSPARTGTILGMNEREQG